MGKQTIELNENFIVRLGLLVAAAYAFYIGAFQWGTGGDALHPNTVILQLLTYLIAFAMLFAAATSIGLRWMRHLILVVFLLGVYSQSIVHLSAQPVTYGTDSAATTHYAAELFAQGKNPYVQDMTPAFSRFQIPWATEREDGPYDPHFQYPALSFLIYVPFLLAGLADARIILLIFFLLTLLLIYLTAPRWLKPLVLIPFFISPEILSYTLGSVTDIVWLFFLVASALLWKRRDASALLYGVAISLKQHPWFLAPFLLVRLWQESQGLPRGARLEMLVRYFGIAEVVFLLTNGPFLLAAPRAWADGVLTPALATVIDGQGLSTLSQIGLVYAPRTFYSLASLVVLAALWMIYALNFKRMAHAIWLFPAIVLWFAYRSLQSYVIYWIPLLLVAFYETLRTPAEAWAAVLDAPERAGGRFSRWGQIYTNPRWRALGSAAAAAAAVVFILGGIAFYAIVGKPAVEVTVNRALLAPPSSSPTANLIDEMQVSVKNESPTTITPVFWIKETGLPRFNWQVLEGPQVLASGMEAEYLIQATYPEFRAPDDTVLSVAVTDEKNANLVGFSPARQVNLTQHASLLNADFFYWSRESSGGEIPYAWGFFQVGQNAQRSASIAEAQIDARQCMALNATQTANAVPGAWLGGYLDQWIEFPNYKFRVPVYPTFRFDNSSVLGIEIRDDQHQLWYIFSDQPERIWKDPSDPNIAYHLVPAPLNHWSEPTITVPGDYAALGWALPHEQTVVQDGRSAVKRMINFRLFVGTHSSTPGTYGGCFGAIVQHLP